LCRQRWQALVLKIRPAIVDQKILFLDVAGLVQTPADGGDRGGITRFRRAAEKTQHRHARLLRPGGNGPCPRRATEKGDEIAPPPVEHQAAPALGFAAGQSTAASACCRGGAKSLGRT